MYAAVLWCLTVYPATVRADLGYVWRIACVSTTGSVNVAFMVVVEAVARALACSLSGTGMLLDSKFNTGCAWIHTH